MDRWYICHKTPKGILLFVRGVNAHTYGRTDDAARAVALRAYSRTASFESYAVFTPEEYRKNVRSD